MRTEEEAMKLTCPHIRVLRNEYGVIHEGAPPIYDHQGCVGSACISWRWGDEKILTIANDKCEDGFHEQAMREGFDCVGANFMGHTLYEKHSGEITGYCGIAGKPE